VVQQLDAKPISAVELQETLIGAWNVNDDWLPLPIPMFQPVLWSPSLL
jgi:hypothetical protein